MARRVSSGISAISFTRSSRREGASANTSPSKTSTIPMPSMIALKAAVRQFDDGLGAIPALSRNSKNSLSGVMTSVEFDPFSAFS